MSIVSEWLVYALFRMAMVPFQIGNLRWARSLGASLGLFAYHVIPIRRKVLAHNLRSFFGKEWTEGQIKDGVRKAYLNFGMALGEFAFGMRINPSNIDQYIKIETPENYYLAHADGRPAVFIGAHQAMWEWTQSVLYWLKGPWYVIMKRVHNRFLDGFMNRRRSVFGANMISQRGAIANLASQNLESNLTYGFMVDQRAARNKGVWVNVRGTPFCSMAGAAVLAVRGNYAIIPLETWRTRTGMTFKVHPPLWPNPTGDEKADVARVSQAIQDQVTGWIERHPHAYFWFHNRFKTYPSETGDPKLTGG